MSATATVGASAATIEAIKQKAKRLSILSMMSTTAAGSGHPTSCMSAAELVAGTFFYAMKFDPKTLTRRMAIVSFSPRGTPRRCFTPRWLRRVFPESRLMTLREFSSELEGHPTPRFRCRRRDRFAWPGIICRFGARDRGAHG